MWLNTKNKKITTNYYLILIYGTYPSKVDEGDKGIMK